MAYSWNPTSSCFLPIRFPQHMPEKNQQPRTTILLIRLIYSTLSTVPPSPTTVPQPYLIVSTADALALSWMRDWTSWKIASAEWDWNVCSPSPVGHLQGGKVRRGFTCQIHVSRATQVLENSSYINYNRLLCFQSMIPIKSSSPLKALVRSRSHAQLKNPNTVTASIIRYRPR